jgi:cytosine/adenosine deaminase-related metal-dependent hydrolase
MPTLLVKDIKLLVTMDDQRREIPSGAIFVRDGVIIAVGTLDDMPSQTADEVIRLPNHIVIPGLVNTHHHMFQSLTRVIAQQHELFDWLTSLYPLWLNLRPEMIYASSKLAMSELILSGCTTSSDHLYLYPNGIRLEDTIQAADELGLRFHPTRGAMTVGESLGGLPPDAIVELDEEAVLRDMRRVIEAYHNPNRHSMVQIAIAPCAPFNVSQNLMRESAILARSYGVRLHTHLAENISDIEYSLAHFGMRPGDYVQDIGWIGDDVWHAHCVQLDDAEIALFARTGTGVAHCPCSNCRLASGIAPIRQMRDSGVRVGLGVDGTASNDSGHLLNEARMMMLLQRVNGTPDPNRMSAREALEIATRGGASVLGRADIGAIMPNMCADFVAYRTDTLAFAGAQHDLVAGLVFCASQNVDLSVINGRVVVRDGQLVTGDLPLIIETHNRYARELLDRAL